MRGIGSFLSLVMLLCVLSACAAQGNFVESSLPQSEQAGGADVRCDVDSDRITPQQEQPKKEVPSRFDSDEDGTPCSSGEPDFFPMPARQPGMDEVERFMDGIFSDAPCPSFDGPEHLDLTDSRLLLNLFNAAVRHNDALLAQGHGVTEEQSAQYEAEAMKAGISTAFFARLSDMDAIGQWYFGKAFRFPPPDRQLLPLPNHPGIYYSDLPHGMPFVQMAMPFAIREADGVLTAKMYILGAFYGVDHAAGTYQPVGAAALCGGVFQEDIGTFVANGKTVSADNLREAFRWLALSTPIERFDVLTVTFAREDGRLIAASAKYTAGTAQDVLPSSFPGAAGR